MDQERTIQELETELKETRLRLEEAEETLRAITSNEVDALVINGPEGQQVFTLQGAEQPYRVLMETMSEGALTVANDGMILYCNSRFAEMLHGQLNRIIGSFFQDIMPSEDWTTLKALLNTCEKEGCRGEYRLTAFEGQEVPVYISARSLRLRDMEGFCIVATGLAEQRALEEQLRQAQKMEAMGTLAGGIAHDFNNMLGAVIGFTEMAIDDNAPDNKAVDHALKNVLKAALRGRDLIKQILAFSRKTPVEIIPLRLTPLVKETAKLLRATLPSNVEIEVKIKSGSDIVLADPSQIQQVIMNLCTNAGFAMREKGGKLTMSIRDAPGSHSLLPADLAPGSYVLLSIKDTGAGVEPDIIKRIFEPFFTTKEREQGTGMGLAVVYGIVKGLHGDITVESEPGKGSTFHVFIPQVESSVQHEPAQGEIPQGAGRVLFVDDEEPIVESSRMTLRRLGYKVVGVTDSQVALSLFHDNPGRFDVVITDQAMPAMSGLNFATELVKIRPHIPIILCTGYSDTVSAETMKEAGISKLLMKPLTKRELAEAIRKVLDAKPEA